MSSSASQSRMRIPSKATIKSTLFIQSLLSLKNKMEYVCRSLSWVWIFGKTNCLKVVIEDIFDLFSSKSLPYSFWVFHAKYRKVCKRIFFENSKNIIHVDRSIFRQNMMEQSSINKCVKIITFKRKVQRISDLKVDSILNPCFICPTVCLFDCSWR